MCAVILNLMSSKVETLAVLNSAVKSISTLSPLLFETK